MKHVPEVMVLDKIGKQVGLTYRIGSGSAQLLKLEPNPYI